MLLVVRNDETATSGMRQRMCVSCRERLTMTLRTGECIVFCVGARWAARIHCPTHVTLCIAGHEESARVREMRDVGGSSFGALRTPLTKHCAHEIHDGIALARRRLDGTSDAVMHRSNEVAHEQLSDRVNQRIVADAHTQI